MKHGFFFHEPETVSSFHDIFESRLPHTSAMITKVPNDRVDTSDFQADFPEPDFSSFCLQAEPLVRLLLKPCHIEKYVSKKISDREKTVALISNGLHDFSDPSHVPGDVTATFTKDGIFRFLETGTLSELPPDFFYPIELKDCLYLIKKMYPLALSGRFRMLKGSLSSFSLSAHITITPYSLELLFSDLMGELIHLSTKEKHLLHSFFEFQTSMEDSGLLASPEESAAFLNSVIEHPHRRK